MAKHESMLWLLLMAGQAAAQTLPDPTAAVHEAHPAAAQRDDARLPSFAALEATGARIGEVRVVTRDIFYTDDPAEDRRRFRWANALHVKTRPEVVERALLFRSGEPVSVRLIAETERLLRSTTYLYDVRIWPLAVRDGVVDIEVATRDTWTLDLGIKAGRAGGPNTSSVSLKEDNLLGTGITLGVSRVNGVDRSGTQVDLSVDRAFGS